MTNSRQKGAAFERQVAKLLFEHLGISFKRDLEQYRKTDHGDLIADTSDFPFLIECKAYARPLTHCSPAWWSQAEKAATAHNKRPAVIWKSNNRPIRCTVNLRDVMECISRQKWSAENHLVEITLEGFCYVAREGMCK